MKPIDTLKNTERESRLYQRRLQEALVIVFILLACLGVRLFYLQIIQHKLFTTLSRQNLMTIIPLAPNRGLITDRNGIILAKNIPVFSLTITPGRVADLPKTLASLKSLLDLSDNDINAFYKLKKRRRRYSPITLKNNLNPSQIAKYYINAYRLAGVNIRSQLIREYPYGQTFAHVLGYVGRMNNHDLTTVDADNYSATNSIGKAGIEKYYESLLHGQVGYAQAETDASGRIVRVISKTLPVAGDNLTLSISLPLELATQHAFGNENGAAVAIDPQNGQILALVSMPGFNPNPFSSGISQHDYQQLLQNPNIPLFNRAIRGEYPPGSTIKPFIALGALEKKTITPNFSIHDPGFFKLPGLAHIYHDWKLQGHGIVNVARAIVVSCDTFFYQLGHKLGINTLDNILSPFGFGNLTGIDLPDERSGNLPTPQWKLRIHGANWFSGDTLITAIGQGYMLTTPMQLAVATAELANHGKRFQPTLLLANTDAKQQTSYQQPILLGTQHEQSHALRVIIRAMQNVILSKEGTGYRFGRHMAYTVAGKTGTSQVISKDRLIHLTAANLPLKLRDHSLFIAFAPIKHPQIAVAVVVEHHPDASLVARKILDAYFRTKQAAKTARKHP